LSKLVIALLVGLMNVPVLRPVFIKKIYQSAGCQQNLSLPFTEVMPGIDRSYHADENCAGCGFCVKVCPVQNIEMADKKPTWLHRCENCLACINWCPQKAIHGYAELPNNTRYHHPDVRWSDVARRD
jgi:Pyruvate/2-oxoacid:ferredoxin oxidoreductase delta subunit